MNRIGLGGSATEEILAQISCIRLTVEDGVKLQVVAPGGKGHQNAFYTQMLARSFEKLLDRRCCCSVAADVQVKRRFHDRRPGLTPDPGSIKPYTHADFALSMSAERLASTTKLFRAKNQFSHRKVFDPRRFSGSENEVCMFSPQFLWDAMNHRIRVRSKRVLEWSNFS